MGIVNKGIHVKWLKNWSHKIAQETVVYFSEYDLNYQFDVIQNMANNQTNKTR
ncbi:MAG: hypothetical protein GKR88_00200 [Flavobacteriaceae bacterium]|nr:MAG: hypothetical protein GKR88_00200 [Flavobacteriaceae bacterium]